MQTEHLDVHDGYGHLYLAWNEPVEAAAGECLPHTEIFRRIARAIGLTEPCLYDSDIELARQLLDVDDPTLAGVTVERLRREGWVRLGYPQPFVPFADGFPTPSGKLEFYSEAAARDGLEPLVGYTPPAEVASTGAEARRHPLVLLAPAAHYFLNSMFANMPDQLRRAGGPQLMMHPGDAAARQLEAGERVLVFNRRGAFEAELAIGDFVRPGVVATTKGYWPKLQGSISNVNATVDERDTDMGRGPVYHDNRVEVSAIR
jgi:anaerobic selenocysteine-containing dehydrogenase